LTLPNGLVTEYAYDLASHLTGLIYKQGGNVIGDLTYEYDADGRRTRMGGSYARSLTPPSLSAANYIAISDQNYETLLNQVAEVQSSNDKTLSLLTHTEGVSELGRYLLTQQRKDVGAFKTPTLRDIELTGPYMHNGSQKTLLDVVKFYGRGGELNSNLDERMRPLNLTDQETNDVVEFLRALTSDDVLRETQSAKPQSRTSVPP